ncbi:MAG: pyruvate kinase, partial [Desulfomonile sp.]|nr:pyruvate kinase [Desulfomonile sp.]
MTLPINKTKIVCTIGPASASVEVLEQMILAGMNVARLNFSHGDFESHAAVISNVRAAAQRVDRRVAIMGDLPGPKIRIGQLAEEPVELEQDDAFTLTTDHVVGDRTKAFVNLTTLPQVVRPGDMLFLNDGIIQLEAIEVRSNEVRCRVVVGGELRSRKGLNLPGLDLGIRAFTEEDRRWLGFAIEQGVDAVSQSFVESASDIVDVRRAAEELGGDPYI